MKVILIYLLIMNAAGFLIMTADKLFAKKGAWRVPEQNLMGIAAVGGSIGVWAAMYIVRHKTKHAKFAIGVPLILAIQIGFVLYFIFR
jgi:uncharacterized membrane protein YsdA (DUF1294 family)